jgi:hypothetical protein
MVLVMFNTHFYFAKVSQNMALTAAMHVVWPCTLGWLLEIIKKKRGLQMTTNSQYLLQVLKTLHVS